MTEARTAPQVERTEPGLIPDERQALHFALKSLMKGTDAFRLGDFHQSLRDLREARNYLRALLREKRLRRARKARSG